MRKIPFLLVVVAILTTQCDEQNLVKTDVQNETISLFNSATNQNFTYSSYEDLLQAIKSETYYDDVKQKLDLLQKELDYIEANKLYELPEKSEKVENYIDRLNGNLQTGKTMAVGGDLFDWFDANGSRLGSTFLANPSMSNKNRASSYRGIGVGTVVLCDKTFFRGSKKVILSATGVTVNLDDFDNRAESYF
jgi:hypothetical protein